MDTEFKLIFSHMNNQVPTVTLESGEDISIDLKFGYYLCDFLEVTIHKEDDKKYKQDSAGLNYTKFTFTANDFTSSYLFLRNFLFFGKHYKHGFSTDLFEAFMSVNGLLLPRVSHEYGVPNDVLKILTNRSIEDSDEYLEFIEMPELFKEINLQLKQMGLFMALKKNGETNTIYHCDNLEDIITASIYHTLKSGYVFKMCGNCEQWFVPYTNKNEEYCDRISPQYNDKTCKEANILIKSNERIKNDEVQKLQKRVYNLYRSKLEAGYGDPEKFEQFKQDKATWKKELNKGLKTEEEYITWLKSHYAKKYS